MPLFYIPDRIELGLDRETLRALNRYLDIAERPKRIEALTARLKAANQKLAAQVAAHPDPDKTD